MITVNNNVKYITNGNIYLLDSKDSILLFYNKEIVYMTDGNTYLSDNIYDQ